MKTMVSAIVALLVAMSNTMELETPNFKVEITPHCEEGVVGCDNVTYRGTSKKTGKSLTLSGKELMQMCSDGVTPCQFLGYEFKNGNVVYFVSEDGHLTVSEGNKVLVDEAGQWKN